MSETLQDIFLSISFEEFKDKFGEKNQEIGSGSQSTVYKSKNQNGDCFAIKEYKKKNVKQMFKYIKSEILALKSLKHHPYILKLQGCFKITPANSYCLVTEFCGSGSMEDIDLLKISDMNKWQIILHISMALQELHRIGYMHRDLKPQNILFKDLKTPKLGDFGLAKKQIIANQAKQLQQTSGIGTPIYSHPSRQSGIYSKKCDVYSFGLIAYFIFTGKSFFQGCTTFADLKRRQSDLFTNFNKRISQLPINKSLKYLLMKTLVQNEQQCIDTEQLTKQIQKIMENSKSLESQILTTCQSNSFAKSNINILMKQYSLISSKYQQIQARTNLMKELVRMRNIINSTKLLEKFRNVYSQQLRQIICFISVVLYQMWLSKILNCLENEEGVRCHSSKVIKTENINYSTLLEVQAYLKQQKESKNPMMSKLASILTQKKSYIKPKLTSELNTLIASVNKNREKAIASFNAKDVRNQGMSFFVQRCERSNKVLEKQKLVEQYNTISNIIDDLL